MATLGEVNHEATIFFLTMFFCAKFAPVPVLAALNVVMHCKKLSPTFVGLMRVPWGAVAGLTLK